MSDPSDNACRLFAILARDGRSAVVFRRGPSRRVLVLRWWLADDRIEEGQWFNGRIYEHRCDLSPDGELLIYFAANWRAPLQSWTAISRPPYLTALVLWPKGDAWGGGGVFDSATAIGLNHLSTDGAQLPRQQAKWHPLGPLASNVIAKRYRVERWSEQAGRGEDNPVHHHRITRDGWRLVDPGKRGDYSAGSYGWRLIPPEIYERTCPQHGLHIRRILNAIHQKNGPWYVKDHEVVAADGARLRPISNCSWADWDTRGDLLFAVDGGLYRISAAQVLIATEDPLQHAKLVADLTDWQVVYRKAADWANGWPDDTAI